MSPQQLQRMIVRMMYDPNLVEEVYSGNPVDGLDDHARDLLCASDRRAWGSDPYRRARSLRALLEEFPVSAALAGVEQLDAFFSDAAFHEAIANGGSLALAFGNWVSRFAGPVAHLEVALARVRRAPEPQGVGIVSAPTVAIVRIPQAVFEHAQSIRSQLGPDPVNTLVNGSFKPAMGVQEGPTVALLVEATPDGAVSIAGASEALAALLEFAAQPRSFNDMVACANRLGAGPDEDTALIESFLGEELLIRVGPPQS